MSFERRRAPGRAPVHPAPAQAAALPPILRLQAATGNRAAASLLARRPNPPRPEFAPVADVYATGTMGQKAWEAKHKEAEAAWAARDLPKAQVAYAALLSDAARTAGADALEDVDVTKVNFAPAPQADGRRFGCRPGLNLSMASGAGKGGHTAWVSPQGEFGVSVSLDAGARQPGVGILLYRDQLVADKRLSLRVLRHEMVHARHRERARTLLKSWGGTRGTGKVDAFVKWMKGNARKLKLSELDIVLAKETAQQGKANTETLAYFEGFMTEFQHVKPAPSPSHAIFNELEGALDASGVYAWRSAADVTRKEALARLTASYKTLGADHRKAFDAWLAHRAAAARASADIAANAARAPGPSRSRRRSTPRRASWTSCGRCRRP